MSPERCHEPQRRDGPPPDPRQDGQALQVVLRSQTLLFRGQAVRERAATLGLLRRVKARSQVCSEAERRKLRGHTN